VNATPCLHDGAAVAREAAGIHFTDCGRLETGVQGGFGAIRTGLGLAADLAAKRVALLHRVHLEEPARAAPHRDKRLRHE
jgi:hypothetical protein